MSGRVKGKQIEPESIDLGVGTSPLSLSTYVVVGTASGKQLINLEYLNANKQDLQETTDIGNITTNDIEITTPVTGVILRAPNGYRWRLTINDEGQIISESL